MSRDIDQFAFVGMVLEKEISARGSMRTYCFHFFFRQATRFVQNRGRDASLADVMNERCFGKPVAIAT